MTKRAVLAFSLFPLLTGCVAAAIPLALGGGEIAGSSALAKRQMSKHERQEASAEAIGHDLNWRKIKVSDISKDGDTVRWTANTVLGPYSCTMLEGRVHAECAPQEGAGQN